MPKIITNHLDLWTSALLAKSSAGRGSNGKQETYGIKKLRELILELAVRGKLVPQDPGDEPASELLKRTIAEKKRLIKEGVIRETKAPVYPAEPPNHQLPASWVWTNLFEIGEIAPRNEADDTVEASFVPMQAISEKYSVPVQHEVKLWGEIKSGFTHFREEDVVLAKITPCFQNGKSAVMRGLTNGFGAGTTELHVYGSINACTVPEYVLVYLKSPRFISDGIPKMTGTAGQKRITRDYFAGNHFPLPPLAEQHRIVAKVDELMALCDQLEQQQTHSIEAHQTLVETLLGTLTRVAPPQELTEAWTRIASHFDTLFTTEHSIDQLKQTILQLAIMGKIVPQDPNDEPVSVLLRNIQAEKEKLIAAGKIKNEKQQPPVAGEEKWFELPSGWEWVRFSDYAIDIATGPFGSMIHQSDYVTNGVPLINPSHMINDQIVPDMGIAVSEEMAKELESYSLADGDIVMARRGEVGRIALVTKKEVGWLCGTGSFVLRFSKNVVRHYLKLVFRCDFVRNYLAGEAVGTTMVNLNHGILRKMPFAVPPVAEQHRIVAKVDELMVMCDTLKARLADAQTTQIHLADAIVEQAVANCGEDTP